MASPPPNWRFPPPRPKPRTLWSDLAGLWDRFRSLPVAAQFITGAVVAVLFLVIVSSLSGPDGTRVATRSTTTQPLPTTTSTTLPPLPPGDDRTVQGVIDGDSFELTDGTKVRLIGIDAPDVENDACFSAEAMSHLRDLLPPGTMVRLVYDTDRTERLGRTLAFVYRLPDGLFVNVAMARDGFAVQPSSATNPHAEEIREAVAEARDAGRGLWEACRTTTTSRRSATTAPRRATTAPPTTRVPTTTVTEPPPTTTPTTSAPTPTR